MQSSAARLKLSNNTETHASIWLPEQAPRACLQIIHGMAEHAGRYARLAQALTGAGYVVYAQDLPGHGRTASDSERGHFADRHGWRQVLDSIRAFSQHIARQHPGLPRFVLGHSMGGYLLQHHVTEHSADMAGAIFSGCSGDLGALRLLGLALIRTEMLLKGPRQLSAVGDLLSFKEFNKPFRPARTDFDWLSRDAAEVDRYVADPLCGFRCTTATWAELLKGCGALTDPSRLGRIRKDLPTLIIAGSRDTAVQGERGPRALERNYRAAGLQQVETRIYPDARHELLNETCREEVTRDLLAWLEAHP